MSVSLRCAKVVNNLRVQNLRVQKSKSPSAFVALGGCGIVYALWRYDGCPSVVALSEGVGLLTGAKCDDVVGVVSVFQSYPQ